MEGKKVIGVMACDPSGIIGNNGGMPWRSQSELQHFLKTVEGGVLLMGRKTFESLPQSLLSQHKCVVFSRNSHASHPNVTFISSIEELKLLEMPKLFMIGGAEIAHLFLKNNLISEFILTIMRENYEGDTKLDLTLLEGWTKEVISTCESYTIYKFFIN